MKWSKLKKLVEERFSQSIKNRVAIYSTAYGNCSCGHAWLTLDKNVVANFCTRAFYNRAMQDWGSMNYENNRWIGDDGNNLRKLFMSIEANRSYGIFIHDVNSRV